MATSQQLANELEDRLIDFAVRVMHVADSLPNTSAGRHVANQALRCGTSPAPNYAEARGAESTADFLHKLKIVQKELNKTGVWLKMISRSKLIKENRLAEIIDESQQLGRIITASIATSRKRSGITLRNGK